MSIDKKHPILNTFNEYFEEVRELVEKLEDRLVEKPSWDRKECTIGSLCEMTVKTKEVILTFDLPYAQENNVAVKPLDGKTVEIIAKTRKKIKFVDFGLTHCQGEFDSFYFRARIPVSVYMDRLKANLKRGILEIRLPRKTEP